MAVAVRVNLAKNAGPEVHVRARVTAAQVLARVASLNEEAAALGLNLEIKKVDLKHVPPVAKAAETVKAGASTARAWPSGDLANPRNWRP